MSDAKPTTAQEVEAQGLWVSMERSRILAAIVARDALLRERKDWERRASEWESAADDRTLVATERAEKAEVERDSLIARVVELERRAKLSSGFLPCGGCGGPHRFDTSVPSVVWNAVIRAKGLSEYLCTACIVAEFVKAKTSFTAELFGSGFHGENIEVRVDGEVAKDASKIQDENNALRWKLHESEARLREANALLKENIEFDTGFEWRGRVETHLSATKEKL